MDRHASGRDALPEEDGLWAVLNRERPIDARTVQILCAFLSAVYFLMAVLRRDPAHPDFTWVRGAVCAQGLLGIAIASRITFRGMRVYSVVLAFLTSLGGGYLAAVLGSPPVQQPLTGLATFFPVVFQQTGADVLFVVPALAIGHAVLLAKDASWMELWPMGLTLVIAHLGLLWWETRYVSASLAYPGLKPARKE